MRLLIAAVCLSLALPLFAACQAGATTIDGYGAYKLGAKPGDYDLSAFQPVNAGVMTLYIEDGAQFEWLEGAPKCSLQLSFETNRLSSIALQFRQMEEAQARALLEQLKQELRRRYSAALLPTSEDDPSGNRAFKLEASNGFIGLYMTVPKEKAVPDPYTPALYNVRLLLQGK